MLTLRIRPRRDRTWIAGRHDTSHCATCGDRIVAGDWITYLDARTDSAIHTTCPTRPRRDAATAERSLPGRR